MPNPNLPKPKRVLIFGTFDIVHPGHLSFVRQAARHGEVIAVVARDINVKKNKGRRPMHDEEARLEEVSLIPGVANAVLGDRKDPYKVLDEYRPDIICLGYDQQHYVEDLRKELKKRKLKSRILRMRPYKPELYKSSKIKRQLFLSS